MYRTIIILFSSLILFSCDNRTHEFEKININFDEISENDHFASSIFTDMMLIRLETTNESVLSDIKKVTMYKNHLYIQDIIYKGIFVFDKLGNYSKKLDKIGRGADEFASADDFIIDESKNTLEVLDRSNSKIYVYEIDGFDLIETINVPFAFIFNFSKNNELYYFQTNKARNLINGKYTSSEIIVFDPHKNKTYSLLENNTQENRHWEFYQVFLKSTNNKLFASLAWHENIYFIEGGNLNPIITINSGKRGIPSEILNSSYDKKMEYLQSNSMKDNIHFFKLLYKEEANYIVGYGIGYPPNVCYYFNLNQGEKIISTRKIINDFYPFTNENIDIFSSDNGKIISVLCPVDLNPNTMDNIGNIQVDDNPVLLIFKI